MDIYSEFFSGIQHSTYKLIINKSYSKLFPIIGGIQNYNQKPLNESPIFKLTMQSHS